MLPLLIMSFSSERDSDKITQIYKEYYGTMMSVAMSILDNNHAMAEDAVSESLIKVMNNLDKIAVVSSYKTRKYIVIIVENTAKNLLRKVKNRKEDDDEDALENVADSGISVIDRVTSREAVNGIAAAICSLPKTLSDAMYLYLGFDYSYTEISDELGISQEAVRMRIMRGRKAVRKYLEDEKHGRSE